MSTVKTNRIEPAGSTAGTVTVDGTMVFTQGATFPGGISVGQAAYFSGGISVAGGISVGSPSYFSADITAAGGISAGSNSHFGGNVRVTGGLSAAGGISAGSNSHFGGNVRVTGGLSAASINIQNFLTSNVLTGLTGTDDYSSTRGSGVDNTVYPVGRVLAIFPGNNTAVTLPTTGTWFYYIHSTGNLTGTSNTTVYPFVGVTAGGNTITPTPNTLYGNASSFAGFIIRVY